VTRLDEFSPIGRLFTLGSLLKISEVAKVLGYFYAQIGFYINFGKKMGTFWAYSTVKIKY
jgi:hypothetical protein